VRIDSVLPNLSIKTKNESNLSYLGNKLHTKILLPAPAYIIISKKCIVYNLRPNNKPKDA